MRFGRFSERFCPTTGAMLGSVHSDSRSTIDVELGHRPPVQVWATRGLASSMHPQASAAAIEMLRAGGNAIDAAIALAAAIAVTTHDWAGVAGDSAWLVYLARTGELHYVDGYSTCPSGTESDRLQSHFALNRKDDARAFREEPPGVRDIGVLTGMVPGTPAAWVEISKRFGKLAFDRLFEPALDLAENGFPVNEYLAHALESNAEKLRRFPSSLAVLADGRAALPRCGDILRQPDLAQTLRRIAQLGHAGFYDGPTAEMIAEYCQRHDGTITRSDLRTYRAKWRKVVTGRYRNHGVIVTAPPTSGLHVLQALNILEGFDLALLPYHGPASLHLQIEAIRVALSDRREAGGDPDHCRFDVAKFVDKAYAAERRRQIDANRAMSLRQGRISANGTTHFCVIDSDHNIVTATQSIGSAFGCGEVIAGTGMFLNDRTWWMSLDEGPNRVMPLHRANIGHAPTILTRDGRPCAALGSPGGFGIIQYVVQVIVNMLDYGLDLQRAIEAPRFRIEDLQGIVGIEQRVAPDTRLALARLGHCVTDYVPWMDRLGSVNGIWINHGAQAVLGGYDPRRNSHAAVLV